MDKKEAYMTYNNYSKKQLMEAYSLEYHAHKRTQENLKRSERQLAELRLMIKELQNGLV